jgi:hypothetical protein
VGCRTGQKGSKAQCECGRGWRLGLFLREAVLGRWRGKKWQEVEVEVKLAKAKVFGSTFFNVTADEWGGSMGRPSRGAGLGYVLHTTSVVTD